MLRRLVGPEIDFEIARGGRFRVDWQGVGGCLTPADTRMMTLFRARGGQPFSRPPLARASRGPQALALWAGLALLFAARAATPTSVVAPTFDELVARSESVVVAQVVATRSTWVDSRAGRAIVTDVTFSIERTLKGPVYAARSLEFLGGTVADDTLHVTGLPEFHVGDRDVLFIKDSGRPVSPIVGFMYGRFRIVRDTRTGAEMVRTHDGRPLASVEEVGNGRPPAIVAPVRTVSLDEFATAIDAKVRAQEQRK